MRRPELPRRWSLRLPTYDYRSEGAYFITVCTSGRRRLLGSVVGDSVRLTDIGVVVADCWRQIPERFCGVAVDVFVVMPNHVHGIVVIGRATHASPLHRSGPASSSLGAVVGSFKAACSRRAGRALWQRGYYERVLRDEDELRTLRHYIVENPGRWALDRANHARGGAYARGLARPRRGSDASR